MQVSGFRYLHTISHGNISIERGLIMCFYIGIEDLAANALIEILKTKEEAQTEQCCVTLAELEAYGNQVIQYLNERGEKAVLILSRENTSLMFRNYSDFFEETETDQGIAIALKEGKTASDLVMKFRTYLALDLMMAFMNTDSVRVLHKANG